MIGQQALQLALRYTAMRRERRSRERHIARPSAPPDGAIMLGGGAHRGDPATPRQFALDSKVTTLLACVLSVSVSGIMLRSGARATGYSLPCSVSLHQLVRCMGCQHCPETISRFLERPSKQAAQHPLPLQRNVLDVALLS